MRRPTVVAFDVVETLFSLEPHCARSAGVDPAALALVAAHAWDIHGAGHAGLITAYVARSGAPFPATMRAPDVTGSSLAEAVDRLLEGTSPRSQVLGVCSRTGC
jgi:FMN phosphatase YigB (HAD superfamily)